MKQSYKTEYTDLELSHNDSEEKYCYELNINLYEKKMILIFSEEELIGLMSFINGFIKNLNT